jgi:hypothetical protein
MAPVAPLVAQQTPTRTGHRSQILLNAGVFKTELLNETIVRAFSIFPVSTERRLYSNKPLSIGKKLKRRLEDLERRAGSSSASPPQVHAQLKQTGRKNESNTYKPATTISLVNSTNNSRQKISPRVMPHNQYTPPMQSDDDVLFSNNNFDRDGSHTPPLFGYHHTYPPPEENMYPPYPSSESYRPIGTSSEAYPEYLAPAPMSLPSMMHFTDAIKREPINGNEGLNPFSMSYAAMAGIDIQGSHSYDESNPHVRFPPFGMRNTLLGHHG